MASFRHGQWVLVMGWVGVLCWAVGIAVLGAAGAQAQDGQVQGFDSPGVQAQGIGVVPAAQWEEDLGRRLFPLGLQRGEGAVAAPAPWGWRVQAVFGRLVQVSKEMRDYPYRLTVTRSRVPDAWSYPGGPVFITAGALAPLRSDDELAGILAHELAHLVLRHAVASLTPAGLQIAMDVAAGKLPPEPGVLGKAGIPLLAQSFSREEEAQADDLARRIMAQAGFDPDGLTLAQRRIAAVATRAGYFRTHPHPGIVSYGELSSGGSGIIITPTPPEPAPPPPPLPPPPVPQPPPAPPAPLLWDSADGMLELVLGQWPLTSAAGQRRLYYREDYLGETNNYELNVQQEEISGATPWGMRFALGRSPGWRFSLAGGWLSGGQVLQAGEGWSAWLEADCLLLAAPGPARPDPSHPSPGQQAAAGLGRHTGTELGFGLGLAWAFSGGQVGRVQSPPGSSTSFLWVDGHRLNDGTPISYHDIRWAGGPVVTLNLPGRGFGISTRVGYLFSLGGSQTFSARDDYGEDVSIPYQEASPGPGAPRLGGWQAEAAFGIHW
ncbi:MAG: M48 family metallopeptidase [Firmicutes bacterium]|nr:M48 family metallopeptidase [Bacillota bacterium]